MRKENLALFIFFLAGLISISLHEPWRDELQVWLLAKHSSSIPDLLHNMRYEGHPSLWHIMVFCLSGLSDKLFLVYLVHLVISTLSAFLILRFSPFTFAQKILILCGYYFIFEYTVIARNYSIEVLLLFLLTALHGRDKRKPLLAGALIFLLCQTNIFGVIISSGFFLLYNLSYFKSRDIKGSLSFSVLYVTGIVLALWQIIPPDNYAFSKEWNFRDLSYFPEAFSHIGHAILPMPELSRSFWDTQLIGQGWEIITLLLLAGFSLRLKSRPLLLAFFWLCTLGLLLFFYSKLEGRMRHYGHFYLLIIITLWLEPVFGESKKTIRLNGLILFILLVQAAAGIFAVCSDWVHPFSMSRKTAEYIRSQRLDTLTIVADPDYASVAFCVYLNKPVLYPSGNSTPYIVWDDKRAHNLPEEDVMHYTLSQLNREKKDIFLILTYPADRKKYPFLRALRSFTGGIVSNEVYYLYLAEYSRAGLP